MGINLSYIFSDRYPLHFVSEQVTTLPKKSDLSISSVGWPKIVYYFSGSAEMTLDRGEIYRIAPRTTVVISGPHGQRYLASDSETPVQLHALIISFEPWRGVAGEINSGDWDAGLTQYLAEAFSENHYLATAGSSVLWNLAIRIRNLCQSNHPMREELVCDLARLFALQVAEFAGIHPGVCLPKQAALVGKACDAVLAAQSESGPVNRQEVAASLGVSLSTLDRAFRECMGASYAGYADWVTMERAKSLLQSSRLTISQVARDLHFGSPGAFGRAFKAFTGVTPGDYQQSYQSYSIGWSEAKREDHLHRLSEKRGLSEMKSWEVLELPASFETQEPCLLLSLEGEIEVTAGGASCHLARTGGAMLLAQGAEVTARSPSRNATMLLLRGAGEGIATQAVHPLRFPLARFVIPLCEWLKNPSTAPHVSLSIKTLLRALWWEALGLAPQERPNVVAAPTSGGYNHRLLIGHAKEFIIKHASRDLTLGEIAWAVGVSEEHLARVFRAETGETVMAFRLSRRLYRAQGMLVRTRKPITEIAEACGFDSAGYFYRAFKQHIGCTPAAFRRKGIGALP